MSPFTNGMIEPDVLINGGGNTIVYREGRRFILANHIFKLFSTNHSPAEAGVHAPRTPLLPPAGIPPPRRNLGYQNRFSAS